MESTITKLPKSQVEVEITVSESEADVWLNKAARRISKEKLIKGFRSGKAPRNIVEREFGKTAVFYEAIEEIIQNSIVDTIIKEKLTVIGQPEVLFSNLAPGNHIKFKAKVSLWPEVELGNYKDVKINGKEVKIESEQAKEKDVQKAVEFLRKSRAQLKDGKEIIPELNDEFVKSLGGFESIEDLKKSIFEGINQENLIKAKEKALIAILKEIAENSKAEIPDVLIEEELNRMEWELSGGASTLGIKLEEYLIQIKKTKEDLRKEWREKAEEKAKLIVILAKIAEKEQIEVSDAETDEESSRIISNLGLAKKDVEKIDTDKFWNLAKKSLVTKKTLGMLEKWNIK